MAKKKIKAKKKWVNSVTLYDRVFTAKSILAAVAKGREQIVFTKNSYLISDGWMDGADARSELADVYQFLIANSKAPHMLVTEVECAYYLAEGYWEAEINKLFKKLKTGEIEGGDFYSLRGLKKLYDIYFAKKKTSKQFSFDDAGRLWLVTLI